MPSVNNVSDHSIIGNPDFRPEACVFCFSAHCWKHGSYIRRGSHSPNLKIPPEETVVPRYLCKRPGCGRTFSVLPSGTLPYCRFGFEDFLWIHAQYYEGMNAYSIWNACRLQQVWLGTVKRLLIFIQRAMVFVRNWCRETDNPVSGDLKSMCFALLKDCSWFEFTSRWYHALYPSRLWLT
jgi:hypothetical protein